ncbi:MAG: ATP synthase F1 subunit epsilon [Nitriliruptoraceae bacterium]
MSDAAMPVEVVSAEGHVLSGDVRELYARGVEGEIGILPGHAPALVALDVGSLRLTMADGAKERVAVHKGVLFVGDDGKVIVLADIAERAEDIDLEHARAKAQQAQQRLDSGSDTDAEAHRASLRKHQLRIQVATGTETTHTG